MESRDPLGSPWLSPSRFVHREVVVLLMLSGVAIVAFLLTAVWARAAHGQRLHDAALWHARGVAHLERGRLEDAVSALGRARSFDRESESYHLDYARALVAAGQPGAAQQALLALRLVHPEDPDVNLGLATVAGGRGDVDTAVRFYQRALYGEWRADRLADREAVRVSLIRYLLANGERQRAAAELEVLSADLPADAQRHIDVGWMLLDAAAPASARARFSRALELDPSNRDAMAGAGIASFHVGDYVAARSMLARAPDRLPGVADARAVAGFVLASDPLARRISERERRRRLEAGVTLVVDAANACIARAAGVEPADVAEATDRVRAVEQQLPRRGAVPDVLLERGVAAIGRAAGALVDACAPASARVRAWPLIAREHGRS